MKDLINPQSEFEGHVETINAIIKRSMTQKIDINLTDESEQEDYIPTMKEQYLKK